MENTLYMKRKGTHQIDWRIQRLRNIHPRRHGAAHAEHLGISSFHTNRKVHCPQTDTHIHTRNQTNLTLVNSQPYVPCPYPIHTLAIYLYMYSQYAAQFSFSLLSLSLSLSLSRLSKFPFTSWQGKSWGYSFSSSCPIVHVRAISQNTVPPFVCFLRVEFWRLYFLKRHELQRLPSSSKGLQWVLYFTTLLAVDWNLRSSRPCHCLRSQVLWPCWPHVFHFQRPWNPKTW